MTDHLNRQGKDLPMSSAAVPMEAVPRFVLSRRALAVFGIVTTITFSAASSAPTPL
jgi:hypothetical protein